MEGLSWDDVDDFDFFPKGGVLEKEAGGVGGKGRRPLVDDEFLGAVGFPGGRRGKRSVRQRRLFMGPLSSPFGRNAAAAAAAAAPALRRDFPYHLQSDIRVDFGISAFYLDHTWNDFRFLLQKELRNSDVGSLGRMVLPKAVFEFHMFMHINFSMKSHSLFHIPLFRGLSAIFFSQGTFLFQKEAEAYLPILTAREGIMINMDDMETLQEWTFKYRFWPNNRSRMYVLENTGEFVKIIRARKAVAEPSTPAGNRLTNTLDRHLTSESEAGTSMHTDLYLPLPDDMSIALDMSDAFLTDFSVCFPNELIANPRVLESVPSLDSIENLSLDDF